MSDTVSVIIPAYEAKDTIGRAIESVLGQTVPPQEIVVVDDGSADNCADLAEAYGEPVRVVRKPNGGPASARNLGAQQAKGEWLAFLDADDIWLPKKLERQLMLAAAPDIAIVHCPSLDTKGHLPDYVCFEKLWQRNLIINSSVIMRRTVFEQMKGFNEDRLLISVEDYNMWLRVASTGWRLRTCHERLMKYTRGVGLSSIQDRFVAAQIHNIRSLGEKFFLSDQDINRKIADILYDAAMAAVYNRDMRAARQYFRKSFITAPSMKRGIGQALSLIPTPLLNIRRHARDLAEDRQKQDKLASDTVFIDAGSAHYARRTAPSPALLVIVDAEEEFEWSTVPSPSMSVDSIKSQFRAHAIYQRYGLVPTYAVDYAVASQDGAYAPLRELMNDGQCDIGAQLHPWINPPLEDELTAHNTFPGNLPDQLHFEKLRILTETIRENFHCQPILYRAGRYGAGPSTARLLKQLGYSIDCSVRPYHDMRPNEGPNFMNCPSQPYWCDDDHTLLELPLTSGMIGALARYGRNLYPLVDSQSAKRLRLPAIASRLDLINRTSITPEGVPLAEAKAFTRYLLRQHPNAVVTLTYHSTSLEAGNTPYVRNEKDLQCFLNWIQEYVEFFLTQCNGRASTPASILAEMRDRWWCRVCGGNSRLAVSELVEGGLFQATRSRVSGSRG